MKVKNESEAYDSWIAGIPFLPEFSQDSPAHLPGSGRSPGEGIDYPLQYSWAALAGEGDIVCLLTRQVIFYLSTEILPL